MSAAVRAALDALRAGRPVLVADDAARENEVDVVLAARDAGTHWLAWTIRHTSGYLCAPMPADLADALDLPLMVARNRDPLRTAYAISVDAAEGVTTGISAADRARTLRVLDDPATGPADLIRPGHVLPLRARPGGVLERPGHTEAATDLVRLAGVGRVAAIAELVEDDGTMTRLDGARSLAERTGLPLLTIADLVEWRRRHDPRPESVPGAVRVERVDSALLPTGAGPFRIVGYRDRATGAEHVALTTDVPHDPTATPLVRVHSECLTGDALGSRRCDCGIQLRDSLARIRAEGGALVYLAGHEGRGIGLAAKVAAYALQDRGLDTVEANTALGHAPDAREYGAAAAILADLGATRIRLLTNNPAKVAALGGLGIDVVERVDLQVEAPAESERYLETKRARMGHVLTPR